MYKILLFGFLVFLFSCEQSSEPKANDYSSQIIGVWKIDIPLIVKTFKENGTYLDSASIGTSFNNNFKVYKGQFEIQNNILKYSSVQYLQIYDSSAHGIYIGFSANKIIEISEDKLIISNIDILSPKQNDTEFYGSWDLVNLIYKKEGAKVYEGREITTFSFLSNTSLVEIRKTYPDGSQFDDEYYTTTYLYETSYLTIPSNATEESPWYKIMVEIKNNKMLWNYNNSFDTIFTMINK